MKQTYKEPKVIFTTETKCRKYKDTRVEKSPPGLNNKVLGMLDIKKKSSVLVLGSGRGVIEDKLLKLNMGLEIFSVDYYCELDDNVKGTVTFIKTDLNHSTFHEQIDVNETKFDYIICVEIIEHMFSQYYFIKNLSKLIKPNGKIIVTTPNVESATSRIFSLVYGRPLGFISTPEPGEHFSPIYENVFKYYLQHHKLQIENKQPYFDIIKYVKREKYSFRSLVLAGLQFLLYPLMFFNRKNKKGYTSIYLLANTYK